MLFRACRIPGMQSGARLLREWIERRGYNQRQTADLLNLHESMVSMLVNAARIPTLHMAVKIEELTGIPVKVWSSSADNKSEAADAPVRAKRRA